MTTKVLRSKARDKTQEGRLTTKEDLTRRMDGTSSIDMENLPEGRVSSRTRSEEAILERRVEILAETSMSLRMFRPVEASKKDLVEEGIRLRGRPTGMTLTSKPRRSMSSP